MNYFTIINYAKNNMKYMDYTPNVDIEHGVKFY